MDLRIIFAVFLVVIALIGVFFDKCTNIDKIEVPGFKWERRDKLAEIDNRGLSDERYYVFERRFVFKVESGDDPNVFRDEALKKMIIENVIKGGKVGRWYKEDNIEDLVLSVDNLYDALVKKRGAIDAYFVLFDHKDSYEEENNLYVYEPTIYVPKERYMRFPDEVRSPLKKYLDHLHLDELQKLNDQNEVVVVLTGIKLNAGNFDLSPINKEKVKEILLYVPDNIRIFIEKIIFDEKEIEIKNFKEAEYIMEGEMIQNLKTFVRNFLNSRPKGYEYDLICIGYSDKRLLNRNIKYYGSANLHLSKNEISMFKKDKKIIKQIKNNLHLSIARAYSGAEIIFKSVNDGVQGDVGGMGADVYYSGGGAVENDDLSAARHIKVKVIKKEF